LLFLCFHVLAFLCKWCHTLIEVSLILELPL
jgi:hypothetical protein